MMVKKNLIFPLFFKNKTGGAVQSTLNIMKVMSNRYNIVVVTVNDIEDDFLNDLSIYKTVKLKTLFGKLKLYKLLNPLTILELKLKMLKFNKKNSVIITSDFGGELLLGIVSPKISRINFARGGVYKTITGNLLKIITFKSVNKFIAVSDAEKMKLLSVGVSTDKIDVIYNGFRPEINLPPVNFNKNELNIACIGYYNDNKNQLLAIKAINSLLNKGYNVNLNMYGSFSFSDKNYLNRIKKIIKEENLGSCIYINEFSNRIDIFSKNDILISTSKDEGFGNTILEAMAYRRPIVTTKSGGLSELLENGKEAIVVNDFSVECVGDGIKLLLDNEINIDKLTNNAYNLFLEEFRLEKQIKKISNIIDLMIK